MIKMDSAGPVLLNNSVLVEGMILSSVLNSF
jgi:hypothetical protein